MPAALPKKTPPSSEAILKLLAPDGYYTYLGIDKPVAARPLNSDGDPSTENDNSSSSTPQAEQYKAKRTTQAHTKTSTATQACNSNAWASHGHASTTQAKTPPEANEDHQQRTMTLTSLPTSHALCSSDSACGRTKIEAIT